MKVTKELFAALQTLESMEQPSVEKILRNKTYEYEADQIHALVEAWRDAKRKQMGEELK